MSTPPGSLSLALTLPTACRRPTAGSDRNAFKGTAALLDTLAAGQPDGPPEAPRDRHGDLRAGDRHAELWERLRKRLVLLRAPDSEAACAYRKLAAEFDGLMPSEAEVGSPLDVRRERQAVTSKAIPETPPARAAGTRSAPRRRREPPAAAVTGAKAPAVQLIDGPRYDLPVIFVAAIWDALGHTVDELADGGHRISRKALALAVLHRGMPPDPEAARELARLATPACVGRLAVRRRAGH